MKKIIRVVLVLLVLLAFSLISVSVFISQTYGGGDTPSVRGPNMGAGPMPSLTPEQKAIRDKKEADFQEWLSKQPKDINPLDVPSGTNQNSVTPLSIESGYISMPLRIQQRTYWCGPASGQEVLDYDWGYLSTVSKYSQSFLATQMGTTEGDGTYVYKLTNVLNQYKYNSNFYWIYYLISSDETTAANQIYSSAKYDVSSYEGLIYHTNTYPFYGTDSWGERYGLIGYFNPNGTNGHSTGHYVAGYGYSQDSSGRHRVYYLDSNDSNYGWGSTKGAHSVDARNMATCVIYNAQYIIY